MFYVKLLIIYFQILYLEYLYFLLQMCLCIIYYYTSILVITYLAVTNSFLYKVPEIDQNASLACRQCFQFKLYSRSILNTLIITFIDTHNFETHNLKCRKLRIIKYHLLICSETSFHRWKFANVV